MLSLNLQKLYPELKEKSRKSCISVQIARLSKKAEDHGIVGCGFPR
jgi:hypothetical protein